MTARERTGPESTFAAVTVSLGPFPFQKKAETFLFENWETWFRDAGQQGLAPSTITQAAVPPPPSCQIPSEAAARKSRVLDHLLAGRTDQLTPVPAEPVVFVDSALDRLQHEAVRRALATPDLFLVLGLPGTGKSRVVTEILVQAALRGERVLFLSQNAAALDVVLERLAERPEVLALRFLEMGETPEGLPAAVRQCTLPPRRQAFQEQALQHAQDARTRTEERCRQAQNEEGVWPMLSDLVATMSSLHDRLTALDEELARIPQKVAEEIAGNTAAAHLQEKLAALQATCLNDLKCLETEARHLDMRLLETKSAVEDLRRRQRDLEQLAAAQEIRGFFKWFNPRWWRARRRDLSKDSEALRAELSCKNQQLEDLEKERQHILQERHEVDSRLEANRSELAEAEVNRRRQDWAVRAQPYQQEHSARMRDWHAHVTKLALAEHRPNAVSGEAVALCQARWQADRRQEDSACHFARRWSDFLAQEIGQLSQRLPHWANVLAGVVTTLEQDAVLADAAKGVDLLLLEEADLFTETDLRRLCELGRRCVLVASAAPCHAALRPAVFHKLWQALHVDSPRLHHAWDREGERWRCRLRACAADERKYLESERVADFPEVEVRILAVPKTPPVLAEVLFPPTMTLLQAKEFIYRELQEAAVNAQSRGGLLTEVEGSFQFLLGPGVTSPELQTIELETGLMERFDASACTSGLLFDKSHWTRAQVEQWLQRQFQVCDLGRTAYMQIPYRLPAGFPSRTLHVEYLPRPGPAANMEWICVPPPRKGATPSLGVRATLPKEGAGLEQDLATPRLADRLPAEFRNELPRRGLVNYLEAQAVIRKLEELRRLEPQASIAVVAMNDSQVALLQRLAGRAQTLRPALPPIGTPASFRHREFDFVLVSLTRSHAHRAVAFGQRSNDLALALSRWKKRLFLFADPGTLAKRIGWTGAVDSLDAAAAESERALLAALVACFPPADG
ncbi:MAG: AAA domain-containing protein [Gemmataceae bacterium]|nr:AAA domain-containing protein [Gemmataceae bacterium]MCI0743157.1 AAA domain-containing protein [Gemmataceae bacterium]